jgi:hypothetical protein
MRHALCASHHTATAGAVPVSRRPISWPALLQLTVILQLTSRPQRFRFSDLLKGGRCFLSRQQSRQQELQPSKQEMEVITGGGQHGVNGIAGMVCKIIAAHAVLGLVTNHWFDGDAPPQLAWLTSILRQHAPGEAQRPAIVNNYATHKHPKVTRHPAGRSTSPRPQHPGINAVEGFFAKHAPAPQARRVPICH